MSQGWDIKKLNDVCELITCGVAARPKYVDEGIPFLSAKNVKNGKIVWNGYNCISEQTHSELTKNNKPLLGDLLYTRVGSYGEAAVIQDDIEFSVFVSLTLIKVKKKILNNYFLKYYLNSNEVKTIAKNSINSSGVGNLNVGAVREFPILLPPLQEQKRIVAILDKTFAAIDKAKTNAEQNLKNAKELFESYLNEIFENKGDGWKQVSLGDLATFRNGMNFTKGSKGEEIRVVGVGDFQNRFWVPLEDISTAIIDGKLKDIDQLTNGDILAVRSNGNLQLIGRVLLAGNVEGKVSHSGFTIRVRLNSKKIYPPYLCHLLKTAKSRRELVGSGIGVNIKSLNQGSLSNLKIKYPVDILMQKNIVKKLESLSTESKKLECIYQKKIEDLEELKKSVLQKAFSGEL